jgi:hypothetical protein
MPFHVVKSKRKQGYWDVENADTGEVKNAKPYPTEGKAQDYAGALNAHSEDVAKIDDPGPLSAFAQLAKIDEEHRQVWGVATAEQPDRSGEVMDYSTSKANFQKWSDEFSKASGGASLGNLRAMHQPVAAGRIVSIDFRDGSKEIYIGAEIVDAQEWEKVLKGVYTGFSIGGRYGKIWKEGAITRYTAVPSEISLVDLPCFPGATFTVRKAGGVEELRKFGDEPMDLEKTFPPKPAAAPAEAPKAEAPAPAGKPDLAALLAQVKELNPDLFAQLTSALQAEEKPEPDNTNAPSDPTPAPAAGPVDGGQPAPDMRAQMLSLLEELGLVEKVEGVAKALHPDTLLKAEYADLQKAELDTLRTAFDERAQALEKVVTDNGSELRKYADDIFEKSGADLARVTAELGDRIAKLAGSGPVFFEHPAMSKAFEDESQLQMLKRLQLAATDPRERQELGTQITQLELKQLRRKA